MKKNYLFLSLALIIGVVSYAQLNTGGTPVSFIYTDLLKSELVFETMPEVDVNRLLAEDAINEEHKDIPWRFGEVIDVDFNLKNSGVWDKLEKGDKLWRLGIKSPGAFTINLLFKNYLLPPGAKLYVYSADKSHIIGAFTEINNQNDDLFATSLIKGDAIIIEYFEPANPEFSGILNLGSVTHAYKDVNGYVKAFGGSGSCNNNVACPESAGWENEINSAVHYITGPYVCSGAMINNTSDDGTPYFLSADHCYGTPGALVFWFNWESTTCTNPGSSPPHNDLSGAIQRARNSDSDFWLVELNNRPQDNGIDVYYAGWNRQDAAMSSSVCIHHPAGDIKKISFDNNAYSSDNYLGTSGIANSHWKVTDWDDGTTEGGSSGSPLFDPNHRIVGQLHGGYAACGNDLADWYGKLSMSWDYGGSSSSQLEDWLDPSGTGAVVIDGYDPSGPAVLTANFSGTPTSVVVGNSVTFTDLSVGGASTWSWSFPGGTPTTATGQGPHTITYNTLGSYNVSLTVTDGGSGSDTETKTNYINVTNCTYCVSTYSNTTDDWISNVTFNTINNNSGQGGSNSYEDYTGLSTDIDIGNSYPISVDLTMNGNWTEHVWVWIDWNQNCDFTDPGESFDLGDVTNTGSVSGSILVPAGALTGVTTMRIIEQYSSDPLPCNAHPTTYGETEDYTVNVVSGGVPVNDDCSGAIAIGEVTDLAYDTGPATSSGANPGCGGATAPFDLWYAYTATVTGLATFDLCGSGFDTRLALWDACGGSVLQCNDDAGPACTGTASSFEHFVFSGNTYYVQVGGYQANTGTGDLTIQVVAAIAGLWTGDVSNDWNTAGNWDDMTVPVAGTDVTIPATAINWPVRTGDLTFGSVCNSVTMEGSSELTIIGDINIPSGYAFTCNANPLIIVEGDWTNSGSFNAGTGTVEFTGTVSSSITGPPASGTIFYDGFESNLGWNLSGEFERGAPNGLGGEHGNPDPGSAYAGSNVLGVDLSGQGTYPGDYENNLGDRAYQAISPTINCSGFTNVSMDFQRWLGVESSSYDHAYIDISNDNGNNWTQIWTNTVAITESGWGLQSIDISSWADNQSQVKIMFSIGEADGSWQYCGWNIDEFELTGDGPGGETFFNLVVSKTINPVTTNSDVNVANNLIVNPDAYLTNNSGNNLEIGGTLLMEATDTGMASFIDNGTTTVAGVSTVEQYVEFNVLQGWQWHLVSSPISDATINVYYDMFLYQYYEDGNSPDGGYWENLWDPVTIPMNVGQGYNITGSNTWIGTTNVNYSTSGGSLNNSDVPITNFTMDDPDPIYRGFKLVGNPFPCALEWNTSWSLSGMSGWMVILDEGIYRGYHTDGTPWQGGTSIIPSTQGFFVRATSLPASLTIPTSQRVHHSQDFYKESNDFIYPIVRLEAQANGHSDESVVVFHPEGSTGFDDYYDLSKFTNAEGLPNLYSVSEGINYAFSFLSEEYADMIVPVYFEMGIPGNFQVEATEINNLSDEINVYLEDLKEGIVTNLGTNPIYEFGHNLDNDPHRFNLHFTYDQLGSAETIITGLDIYSFGQVVYIKNPDLINGEVTIYNVMGNVVEISTLEETPMKTIPVKLNAGYYFVKIQSGNSVISEKVFIK